MSSFKSSVPANVVDRGRVADQIFRDLRNQIVIGVLPRGAKLPSERELAEKYGVSGPTVREAVRGLTAMGLADVRHGSGAYVTAATESLIAMSLGTVIQLEGLGAAEVLSILGVLNEQAAGLASLAATEQDHAQLRAALAQLEMAKTAGAAAAAVRNFHRALAVAAHNPLLAALCGFLADIQVELGMELTGDSFKEWKRIFSRLKPVRYGLVDSIIAGDHRQAVVLAKDFHAKAVSLITSLPKAKEVRLTDPKLRALLSAMMSRIGSK
jgi:GntR family transcriptional regulator, transcriptional repressor for pyruvate dehydrogenase complex